MPVCPCHGLAPSAPTHRGPCMAKSGVYNTLPLSISVYLHSTIHQSRPRTPHRNMSTSSPALCRRLDAAHPGASACVSRASFVCRTRSRRRVWRPTARVGAFRPMCSWLVYTAGPAVQPVHYMYGWTYALPHAHHGHVGAHCGRGIRWFDVRLHFRWARARFFGIMMLSWAASAVGRMGTVMGKSCPGSHKADHRPL